MALDKWKKIVRGAAGRWQAGLRHMRDRARELFADRLASLWRGLARRVDAATLLRWAALCALVALLGTASVAARARVRGMEGERERQVTAAAQPPEDAAAAPEPTPEPRLWAWPAPGELLTPHSPEALLWSETLGQWQAHPGVDIAAAPGEAVYACGDGTVADAYRDRLWGNVIVVDHGDGYVSTYASLNTLELVTVGEAVRRGDVISAAGRSADCEAALGWHVHFALEKDGAPVDFAALCPR